MKPSYTIEKLLPYLNIEKLLGENEAEDPYYFNAFIQQIKNSKLHELTHTYCHYYCLEPGQIISTI
jgi:hypothetical protein